MVMASNTTNIAPGSAGQNGALGERWEVVEADDDTLFIATAGDIVCCQDPNHAADDEWDRRNFRLIAAAPQMLDALVWAMAELDGVTLYDTPEQRAACVQQARTAIAAATGEAV